MRRNLSAYDRSALALQLEPLYAAEAKRKSQANLKRGDMKPDTPNLGERDNRHDGETLEQLAKLAGTSRDTIRKVKVIEAIRATPPAGEPPKAMQLQLIIHSPSIVN